MSHHRHYYGKQCNTADNENSEDNEPYDNGSPHEVPSFKNLRLSVTAPSHARNANAPTFWCLSLPSKPYSENQASFDAISLLDAGTHTGEVDDYCIDVRRRRCWHWLARVGMRRPKRTSACESPLSPECRVMKSHDGVQR
jgi:hypothetical protein